MTKMKTHMTKMKPISEKQQKQLTWMAVGGASAMLAGMAMERILNTGWRYFADDDPPDSDSGWPSALAWTALSAAAVGAAQLVGKNGAGLGWQRTTGRKPPKI